MPKKTYSRILDEHLHTLIAQGNHEAYLSMKKSYHMHALSLCSGVLTQYPRSGVTRRELIAVCDNFFPWVVFKFNPTLSSFFSFWKESTMREIMDYMMENSYGADAYSFKGIVSFDQQDNDHNSYSEFIAEVDEDPSLRRRIFEVKGIINRYSVFFTNLEKAVLLLMLDGYSIQDLEQARIMSKSTLYLTFNTAVEKLKNCLKRNVKKY